MSINNVFLVNLVEYIPVYTNHRRKIAKFSFNYILCLTKNLAFFLGIFSSINLRISVLVA